MMVASAVVGAVALVACRGLIGYEDGLALEPGDGAPADGDTSDRGGPDAVDASGLLRVFVTSRSIAATGMPDAGALCSSEALGAGLVEKPWVAWRSSSTQNAVDLLPDGGAWHLTGAGEVPFITKGQIASGDLEWPKDPLRLVDGGDAGKGGYIWTATGSSGTRTDNMHCINWSSSADGEHALAGETGAIGSRWTYRWNVDCNQSARVICFELPP